MSLYKDASLVMIPSAYKDGKLYSIRPTDGSGDFTFSRGSNLAATRVDVNGLIEKGRENLLLQSNQFDTTWGNANSTDTGGQQGYDGSNNAWLIQSTNTDGRIEQSTSYGSGVRTFSVYAKAGTSGLIRVRMQGGANAFADFDLDNGVVDFVDNDVINAVITSVGNGWYRCSINTNDTNTKVYLYVMGASGLNLYIQDAQLEQGLVATDYIETGASTAQAGILEDMPRLDYSGGASCPALLLEPQRTNLVTNSEYFAGYNLNDCSVTSNAGVSPDGLNNATKHYDGTGSGGHYISSIGQLFLANTNIRNTSVFVKAGTLDYVQIRLVNVTGNFAYYLVNVNLNDGSVTESAAGNTTNTSNNVEDYGNGWYRITLACSFTSTSVTSSGMQIFTAKNNSHSYVGTGTDYIHIYGAQHETGSYSTSYIPTYGTSQTRSGDDFVLNLATDIVQNGGTFMIELEGAPRGAGTSTPFIQFNHTNSASYVGFGATGNWRCRINDNGTAHLTTSPIPHTDNAKLCIRYGDFGYEYYANGSSFDTYGNAIELGDFSNISFSPNDVYGILRVKQFLTFPTALTDSECIALTTI